MRLIDQIEILEAKLLVTLKSNSDICIGKKKKKETHIHTRKELNLFKMNI